MSSRAQKVQLSVGQFSVLQDVFLCIMKKYAVIFSMRLLMLFCWSVCMRLCCVCKGTIGDRPDDGSLSPPFKPTGTCFRCGQDGHWARQCKGAQANTGGCSLCRVLTDCLCKSDIGDIFDFWQYRKH